jgi:hypothetical protein
MQDRVKNLKETMITLPMEENMNALKHELINNKTTCLCTEVRDVARGSIMSSMGTGSYTRHREEGNIIQ